MNLVAKEYVAAQDPDDPGVLILSEFAGAARELDAALLVNPYDEADMARAMDRALSMAVEERQERHQAMLTVMRTNSLERWRDRFEGDLRADRRRRITFGCSAAAMGFAVFSGKEIEAKPNSLGFIHVVQLVRHDCGPVEKDKLEESLPSY